MAQHISIKREQKLIRLLLTFLCCGLIFMLLPGTFLGVWNLFNISNTHSATSISAAWLQAHGHAQLFGWIGSFILGIGFYSIPNLRKVSTWSFIEGWLCLFAWASGVSIRWFANIYLWHWKILLPVSAVLEFVAMLIYLFIFIKGHILQKNIKGRFEPWAVFVVTGTLVLVFTTALNMFESFKVIAGISPTFPDQFENKFLVVAIWGAVLPIVWGFSLHWLPALLALKTVRFKLATVGLAINCIGLIFLCLSNSLLSSTIILLLASIIIVYALGIFEVKISEARVQGIHKSFPWFIELAYIWLIIAGLLTVWSALETKAVGIRGAGRHAITVGFLLTMVFTVAPRIIPTFLGRKKLFSKRLMFSSLILASIGCLARVISEILAYRQNIQLAWDTLPISATLELLAVTIFAINMIGTFLQPPLLSLQK